MATSLNPGIWGPGIFAGGLFDYARQAMQQQQPTPPAMPPSMSRDYATALMNGGYTDPNNEAANRRIQAMDLQARARRQLADAAFKEQMAYRNTVAEPQLVRNGVAYMDGQPVGFVGPVSGVRPGIPEAGFTGAERAAFQRQMRNYLSAGPVQGPRNDIAGPLNIGQVPVVEAASPMPQMAVAPMGSVAAGTRVNAEAEDPLLGPVLRRNVRREIISGTPQIIEGATITERQQSKANTERGLAARKDLEFWQKSLPNTLAAVTEAQGVAVDEETLAATILAEAEMAQKMGGPVLPVSTVRGVGIALPLAQRLGVDPKVLIRWAQDRKKTKKT